MANQLHIIVHQGSNPTTEYYFPEELETATVLDLHTLPRPLIGDSLRITFIRYISKPWAKWIEQNKQSISSITLFIDDDVFDLNAWSGLPLKYRWKLYKLAYSKQGWMKKHGVKLAVSTPYLAEKYKAWQPMLIEPKPILDSPRVLVTVYYHGSASHKEDIDFLYGVMKNALSQNDSLQFEIIGNSGLNKRFKRLPRTIVVHPISWESYKTFNLQSHRSIGLAPLVTTGFNKARSSTKYFDITAANTIGVYAKEGPYAQVVNDGENGRLVEMTEAAWVEAILELAEQREVREAMLSNAKAHVETLKPA